MAYPATKSSLAEAQPISHGHLFSVVTVIARRLRVSLLALLAILLVIEVRAGAPTVGWPVVSVLSLFAAFGALATWLPIALRRDKVPPLTVEVGGDSCAALACLLLIDAPNAPLAWLLLAIPVVVASVRHSIALATLVWCSLILGYVAVELSFRPAAQTYEAMAMAVQLLTAVGILGLPGSFLVRHLVAEVDRRESARALAERQAGCISLVARAAHEFARAGSKRDLFDRTVEALLALKFSTVEIFTWSNGQWTLTCRASDALEPIEDDVSPIAAADGHQTIVLASPTSAVVPVAPTSLALRVYASQIGPTETQWLELLSDHLSAAWVSLERTTHLERQAAELGHTARHDALTGLPNRLQLLETLGAALDKGLEPAVLYLDLDGFKAINDTYGHEAGDLALVLTARRMRDVLRPNDMLARLAGDEFVVVLQQASTAEALVDSIVKSTAQRIIDAASQPFDWDGVRLRLGVSVGGAHIRDADDPRTLLQRADRAMYQAKRSGGSRACIGT